MKKLLIPAFIIAFSGAQLNAEDQAVSSKGQCPCRAWVVSAKNWANQNPKTAAVVAVVSAYVAYKLINHFTQESDQD